MAVNDDIMDAQVSHAVGLQRLATGILRKILRLLNRTDADLEDQIRQRLAGVEAVWPEQLAAFTDLPDALAFVADRMAKRAA